LNKLYFPEQKYNYYTGIGSRSTPKILEPILFGIAKKLEENDFILRSGGADGADKFFELGALSNLGRSQIFLPWKFFNYSHSSLFNINPQAFTIAKQIHPNWNVLTDNSKKLHARNVHQVLGEHLNSPSLFLICWTPNGKIIGGTATAINLAKEYNIPVFNLGKSDKIPDPNTFVNYLTKKFL